MGFFDKAEQIAREPKNVQIAITKYKQLESQLKNMRDDRKNKGNTKTLEQKMAEKNLLDQMDVIWWVIKAADRTDELKNE